MNINLLLLKIEGILKKVKAREGNLKSARLIFEIDFSPVGDMDIHYSVRQRELIK